MEVYSISTVMQGMQKECKGTSAANKQEPAPARGDYSFLTHEETTALQLPHGSGLW